MKSIKHWKLIRNHNHQIEISCDHGYKMHIFVLENDLLRIAFTKNNTFKVPHTWAIAPNQTDVFWQGRNKWSLEGFTCPDYAILQTEKTLEISTALLKVTIHHPLYLEWEYKHGDKWKPLFKDRKTGAYLMGISNTTISHYLQRDIQEHYYGLGEKTGNLNRHGRRFEMRNIDAMGYNAEYTDPLYKHIPFYITHAPEVSYGLYYDNLAPCWFTLGSEIDNYHSYYRNYKAEDGDLDYYVILGPKILDVTKKYCRLTGGTIFAPKWSLGYSGSTMYYTDAPDAQEQLKKFVNLCNEHDIPCDSFQLSSGYTSINGKRYVFNWNYNNEFEVWDNYAKCHYFGEGMPIKLLRPLQPLLMMRASYEAQLEHAPNKRPYLISRSGSPGMNRYVQTWSGDNRTSWNTLHYNIKMGLGMSLSALYNVGHDVGGFSGNKPDPELFVRWVQNGVMHPRFTIHSWNDDKTVNEPWMYPQIINIIRDAIQLRYILMPYLYNTLWKAHHEHEPILRPTFLDHEHDTNTFEENDDYLLGEDLLVASVVEPNQRKREVYLPQNFVGWYDFYTHKWFNGGEKIIAEAPLEKIPLFLKAGSIIPMAKKGHKNTLSDNYRELLILPFINQGEKNITLFDDDGESFDYLKGKFLKLNIHLKCTSQTVELVLEKSGDYLPKYNEINFNLPNEENRKLIINGKTVTKGYKLSLSD